MYGVFFAFQISVSLEISCPVSQWHPLYFGEGPSNFKSSSVRIFLKFHFKLLMLCDSRWCKQIMVHSGSTTCTC